LTSDIWVRATLQVNNGSAGNTCTFYTSSDGAAWTVLGTPDIKAGVTSVFVSTSTVQFIGRGAGSITSISKDVKFYEMQLYGSLDNTNQIAWIDVGSVPLYTAMTSIAYRDDCSNDGTIFYQTSQVIGSPRLCLFNASIGGTSISYAYDVTRFPKISAGQVNIVFINYSHNEGAVVTYQTSYKTLTDLIIAKNPYAAIIGCLQNKRYSPASFIEEHEIRNSQIAQHMLSSGFDIIDFFSIVNAADMNADGIHPVSTTAKTAMGNAAINILLNASGPSHPPA
jgi:hypothetical protein